MKKGILRAICLALLSLVNQQLVRANRYDVAAFVYPAYCTDDPRLRPFWPMGMGEWETVLTMQQRFPGHPWNRRPLWGYVNEADPAVMEMEIEQASDHGVNVFIFDWYWFDGRPFMETTLRNGFLKARNRDRMKFYLMWANHDVLNLWDTRLAGIEENNIIWQGKVDRDEFERICRRNIDMYFKLPEYYKIDGKPVFMIYDVHNLIEGLGGVVQMVQARSEEGRLPRPRSDAHHVEPQSQLQRPGRQQDRGSCQRVYHAAGLQQQHALPVCPLSVDGR